VPLGELRDVDARDACLALTCLAHVHDVSSTEGGLPTSTEEHGVSKIHRRKKGEIALSIFDRLSSEEEFRKDSSGYIATSHVDNDIYHETLKCLAKSRNQSLIRKADDLLRVLEQDYLKDNTNKLHPLPRSYSHMLDAVPYIETDGGGGELVDRVKDILKRVKIQADAGNPHVSTSTHIYNSALNSLASIAEREPAAVTLVEEMIVNPTAELDKVSFSIAIKAILSAEKWSRTDELSTTSSAKTVEQLLIRMEAQGLGNPNQWMMTPILDSLSRQGSAKKILHLLEWMEGMHQSNGWQDIRPNRINVNTMLSAMARANNFNESESMKMNASQILEEMKKMYDDGGNEDIRPDILTYNSVLYAIAKEKASINRTARSSQHESDKVRRVEMLLKRMEEGKEGDTIKPDIFSYNAVLTAYMESMESEAATKARKLLQHMTDRGIEPDLKSYTICINVLGKSTKKGAACEAQELLETLEQRYKDGCEHLKPDLRCYNSVIHAWTKSNEKGSFECATQILNNIETLYSSGERPDLKPDVFSYSMLISALASKPSRSSARSAQDILDRMMCLEESHAGGEKTTLDSGVLNAVMHVQSKSGEVGSAAKAESMLNRVLEGEGPVRVRPNTITFNSVIDAWSKSGEKDAATRAEEVLYKMQELYKKGYGDVRPDTLSFASVLNAHANSREPKSAEKAEKILKHMQTMYEAGNLRAQPNTICFATVIKAYSRSREIGAAERAEGILNWMFDVYAAGNLDAKPNTIAFTSVCDAWCKSRQNNAVEKVENLISRMKRLSLDGFDVYPNEYTYNCLISTHARNNDSGKVEKAVEILRRMQDEKRPMPNLFTFNAVLNACAFTKGTKSERINALKTAILILEEALNSSKNGDPVNVTYGAFFQACGSLMKTEDERKKIQKIVEAAFHRCCKDGQIDRKLLGQIRKASSNELYFRLFGDFDVYPAIHMKDIPVEWRRNVRNTRKNYI